jgi:hypothetical protein
LDAGLDRPSRIPHPSGRRRPNPCVDHRRLTGAPSACTPAARRPPCPVMAVVAVCDGAVGEGRRRGPHPNAETVCKGTGCRSLTNRSQRFCSEPCWRRLAKRRRALLESNPPRNSQSGTHRDDEPTRSSRRVVLWAAAPSLGRRRPPPGSCFAVTRSDR